MNGLYHEMYVVNLGIILIFFWCLYKTLGVCILWLEEQRELLPRKGKEGIRVSIMEAYMCIHGAVTDKNSAYTKLKSRK